MILMGIFFFGCTATGKIEIIGVAGDAKFGAVVVAADSEEVYYIDKLDYWGDDFINQSIIVTGKIDTVTYPIDSMKISQTIRLQYIVRNPKYKLVKK
jgi:hypothetical protein